MNKSSKKTGPEWISCFNKEVLMRSKFLLIILTFLALSLGRTAHAQPQVVQEYEVKIFQSSVNPREFILEVPTDVITPLSINEVVRAGTLADPEIEILNGPFDWHPGFAGGWLVTIEFNEIPETIRVEVSHLDLMALVLYDGEGLWLSPELERNYIPIVLK